MCVNVCHTSAGALGIHKQASDFLELKLQAHELPDMGVGNWIVTLNY